MKTALVLSCLLAVAAAAPQFLNSGNRFRPSVLQQPGLGLGLGRPIGGLATGSANANVGSALNSGPGGSTSLTSVNANTQGAVIGPGVSTNAASVTSTSIQTPFVSQQISNSQVQSNQQGFQSPLLLGRK